MARQPRFTIAGVPQHAVQRGNNRQSIFRSSRDYSIYLYWLAEACTGYGLELHAYVLMTNHVHLLATPIRTTSISKVMQSLGRRYVQYFNRKYQRTGTLWEGRYRATVVDTARYFLTCTRYIEQNPLRAGLVGEPAEYPWSSYRRNALCQRDDLITEHEIYRRLGETAADRATAYSALCRERLVPASLNAIREATNKAWALGAKEFSAEVEKCAGRPATPRRRGRPKKNSSLTPIS